mmetsp:Transcript_18906/g.64047  ORF Transcript_18906/g.64047 Transcript_18906/m.64047 type:complete len:193 (+) Transcript_18906:156-734(+)
MAEGGPAGPALDPPGEAGTPGEAGMGPRGWGGCLASAGVRVVLCVLALAMLLPRLAARARGQGAEAAGAGGTRRGKSGEREIPAASVVLRGSGVFRCRNCLSHVSTRDDVISKCFHGRGGRAYLVTRVVNVDCGATEDRMLLTGLHTVCDIACRSCNETVGWKYEYAYEDSQKYKIGRFIVERSKLDEEDSW